MCAFVHELWPTHMNILEAGGIATHMVRCWNETTYNWTNVNQRSTWHCRKHWNQLVVKTSLQLLLDSITSTSNNMQPYAAYSRLWTSFCSHQTVGFLISTSPLSTSISVSEKILSSSSSGLLAWFPLPYHWSAGSLICINMFIMFMWCSALTVDRWFSRVKSRIWGLFTCPHEQLDCDL